MDVIPHFDKELTDLLCYDGDAIEFECRVSGNPEPYIRWFHYNEVWVIIVFFSLVYFAYFFQRCKNNNAHLVAKNNPHFVEHWLEVLSNR